MKSLLRLFLFHCYLIGFLAIQNGCKPKEDSLSVYQNNIIYCKIIGPRLCGGVWVQVLKTNAGEGLIDEYYDLPKYNNVIEVVNMPLEYKKKDIEICFKYSIPEDTVYYACTAYTVYIYVPQVTFIEITNCDN